MKSITTLLAVIVMALASQSDEAGPTRGNGSHGTTFRGNVGTFRSFGYGGYGYGFAPSYSYNYTPVIVQQPLATFVAPVAPVQQFADPAYAPTLAVPVQQFAAPALVAPTYFGTYGGYNTFRGAYGVRGVGGVGRTVIIRR